MNGKRAKAIRKYIYGYKVSSEAGRIYETERVYETLENGMVVADLYRRKYKAAKRNYKRGIR